jgi:tetratricopeptide (TPR) repeat protein
MATLVVTLAVTPLGAQPSVWRLAAQPERTASLEAHERASALLNQAAALGRAPAQNGRLVEEAQRILERAGADESDDPYVRRLLARSHSWLFELSGDKAHLERAAAHYAFVAATDAPTTIRAEAYTSLAICYARLGLRSEEIAAYDGALALEPDPESHAVLLANRAEGEMARGRIVEAVRGYRAALRATAGMQMLDTGVTTLWGMAVALDRAGDLPGALEHIGLARAYDPVDLRINGPNWFYVPEYDEAWYAALGHWQRARSADETLARLEAYRDSEGAWRSFLSLAAADDPWLPLASQRLSELERERRAFASRHAATAHEE